MGFQDGDTRRRGSRLRALRLLGAALFASLAMCFAAASSASAFEVGLMAGGNAWQEESEWNVIQHSGVKVFRLMLSQNIYFSEGHWAQYDKAFRFAAERGITILPYFYGYNGTSRFPTAAVYKKPTGEAESWKDWVTRAVQRYGVGGTFWTEPGHPANVLPVKAWEVWNEPNRVENDPILVKEEEKAQPKVEEKVQPENYAEFLKYTAPIIRSAQPGGTKVLFGGLFSNPDPAKGMGVAEFLEKAGKVTETGAAFNGLSLHPYSLSGGLPGFKANVKSGREALSTSFDPKKTLWITELGWPVGETAVEAEKHTHFETEQEQSALLTESINWLREESPENAMNIPAVFWFDYRDHPNHLKTWADYCGLRGVAVGAAFRPAWFALEAETGAPAWPAREWIADSLPEPGAGSITSDPDVSSRGAGGLDVFARGPKNELVLKRFNGVWNEWEVVPAIGAPTELLSGPSAVSWGPNRIDVVARVPGNIIGHWAYDGSGWTYDTLGAPSAGLAESDPDISSRGYGLLSVFVRNRENKLALRYFNGVTWSSPEWEIIPGGSLISGPGSVSWGLNRIDVVGEAPDGSVVHWAWTGTKWFVDGLEGSIASDPDISTRGPLLLDIFAKGTGGELVHKWYENGWSSWESRGGSIASGPGAVSWNGERIDVVAQATAPSGTVGSIAHWAWGLPVPP